MKLWIAIVVLMFATVGHAGKAEAGFYSGNDLLGLCESDSVDDRNDCVAYLAGVSDLNITYDSHELLILNPFCLADGVTTTQLQKVVIKSLNENPEKLHLGAASLVVESFIDAFPCD